MSRILTIGFLGLLACAKNVPPQSSSAKLTTAPEVESDSTVNTSEEVIESVAPSSEEDSGHTTEQIDSGDSITMHITVGLGSEQLLAVNVSCGEFRVRRSIQNKEAVIPNVPLHADQCKLKFSPGGAVYILQNYQGAALECTVINGNQASCK